MIYKLDNDVEIFRKAFREMPMINEYLSRV